MPEDPLYNFFRWTAEMGFALYKDSDSDTFEGQRNLMRFITSADMDPSVRQTGVPPWYARQPHVRHFQR